MGRNRTMASPEAYPAIFHEVCRNGSGIIFLSDVPWTGISTAKRFRLFLALLKSQPAHPLHAQANRRWSVLRNSASVHCNVIGRIGDSPSLARLLIDAALSMGNRGKP